ncbi:MAG: Na/Pi cotransporter family protein [Akkermansiaceae bacterium]
MTAHTLFLLAASNPVFDSSVWKVTVGILGILGALGVFLYGMKVMSEGVQAVAGDKMRSALATMTKNRFSGMVTGLFTTGLVQSSSATTVLVVSFVNAGLLTLVESIGVIMGANLGTTVTAWIIAVVGKFKVSAIALPVIGVGLPLFFIGKNKLKSYGEVLIGFGLLFFGLALLKDAVPDVKTALKSGDVGTINAIRSVIDLISGHEFGSVILFMIGGVVLTFIVQSSSAAMAITITCATQGWLGDLDANPQLVFQNSAAIVMGENIGTTITAWLASIGTTVNAKRAARAHFLFNVIGVLWMLAAFYVFTPMVWDLAQSLPESLKDVKSDFDAKKHGVNVSNVAFATAIFHTAFNLANIAILIWFVPQIAKVVQRWVKDKEPDAEQPRLRYISQNLVDLGELNLAEAESAIRNMSSKCVHMFRGFVDVFEHPKEDMSEQVSKLKDMEEEADVMMQEITEYLVRCSSKDIGPQSASKIASMMRVTQELEECTDSIYRLVKLNERRYNKNRQFPQEQADAIREFAGNIDQFLSFADLHLLESVNEEEIARAEAMERTANTMRKKLNKGAMKRMADGDVKLEMINIDINNHFEAIADHALNVVEAGQGVQDIGRE